MRTDAGEIGPSPRVTDARGLMTAKVQENGSRYIGHMMHPLPIKKLDYILLTRFRDDHLEDVQLGRGDAPGRVLPL